MFFNALIQVSACVADIIRIAQITLEKVNNALLVNNRGFAFFWPDDRSDLLGRTRDRYLLRLNSPSCVRIEFSYYSHVLLTGVFNVTCLFGSYIP